MQSQIHKQSSRRQAAQLGNLLFQYQRTFAKINSPEISITFSLPRTSLRRGFFMRATLQQPPSRPAGLLCQDGVRTNLVITRWQYCLTPTLSNRTLSTSPALAISISTET